MMGWTTLHRERGISDRAFFEREFPEMLTRNGRIVACATVNRVFYAAVANHDDAPSFPGETWALVVLTQRMPRADYFNFGYKEMSDSMGPNAAEAPAKVLDALTPTDEQYANEWRQACRDRLAKLASVPKVTRGTVIRFAAPLSFNNGMSFDTFTFEHHTTFLADGRYRVRIPHWKSRKFEVVS